jgi:hypothetical protein
MILQEYWYLTFTSPIHKKKVYKSGLKIFVNRKKKKVQSDDLFGTMFKIFMPHGQSIRCRWWFTNLKWTIKLTVFGHFYCKKKQFWSFYESMCTSYKNTRVIVIYFVNKKKKCDGDFSMIDYLLSWAISYIYVFILFSLVFL